MRRSLLVVSAALAAVAAAVVVRRASSPLPAPAGPARLELGGVRVECEGAGCAALPRDPDGLLAAARALTFPPRPAPAVVRDREGELALLVRERARRRAVAARPLLVVGWDGADPRVVEDLVAAGMMPHLQRLRAHGIHGRLRSHPPYLSPLLWTSVATGKRPEEHGILDFVEPGAGGAVRPVGPGCRRSTTLWRVASDLGRRVLVVNWWATGAEPVNGLVVSDQAIRSPAGPDPAVDPWRARPGDAVVERVLERMVRGPRPDDPRLARLAGFVAEALTVAGVAGEGLRRLRPDLALVYFELPDQSAHLFVREMPPRLPAVGEEDHRRLGGVVHGSYLLLDALLGQLLEAAAPGTATLLVSDHGFVYGAERGRADALSSPLSDALHAPEGIYLLSGVEGAAGAGPRLDLHDLAPTILALAGLPPALDMAGRTAPFVVALAPPAVATHEVEPAPPPLALLDGTACAGGAAVASPAERERLEQLEALGYLAGAEEGGRPVLPLANLGRSLLDAGRPAEAAWALGEAGGRRPGDRALAYARLQALLALDPPDLAAAEEVARAQLAGGAAAAPDIAFVLAELWLARGEVEPARRLAAEVAGAGADGALTAMLVAAWSGDHDGARGHALRAAALDPARAVDTVMALGESASRDLGVEELVEALARAVPVAEVLRAPTGSLGTLPERTLTRAREAESRRFEDRSPADRLWLRRASAWAAAPISPAAASRPGGPDPR